MSARAWCGGPARRLGDEWIWVGFPSVPRGGSAAEHAALELERLHVDELARLLLQAAEFRLCGAPEARPRAAAAADRWGARSLEFEAWRSALDEQLAALRADGAVLSARLAGLVDACLAAAADGAALGSAAANALATHSQRRGRRGTARASAQGVEDRPAHCGALAAANEPTVASVSPGTVSAASSTVAASDGAARRRAPSASERWPAARELAQAARVLAPSARSHCALGRALLAVGDAAAARGCFLAALASTSEARLQREAQRALDELVSGARLSSAVGAEALELSQADVPHS